MRSRPENPVCGYGDLGGGRRSDHRDCWRIGLCPDTYRYRAGGVSQISWSRLLASRQCFRESSWMKVALVCSNTSLLRCLAHCLRLTDSYQMKEREMPDDYREIDDRYDRI